MMRRSARYVGAAIFILALVLAATGSAGAAPSDYGIASFTASQSTSQAGGHPDLTIGFAFKTDENGVPFATTKDLTIQLPPGLVGNPAGLPTCNAGQLATSGKLLQVSKESCPQGSQVGITQVLINNQESHAAVSFNEPVFNMAPPGGDVVARFGFLAQYFPTFIDIRVDPERDYAFTATIESPSGLDPILSAQTTLWGVPAAKEHDAQRITPYEASQCGFGGECSEGHESELSLTPFMTNPTSCGGQRPVTLQVDSWAEPGVFRTVSTTLPPITGCGLVPFQPKFLLRPTSTYAESPAGAEAEIELPQQGLEQPNLLATGHLNRAVVKLPAGMTLNPGAASGLGACTEAQIGLVSESPIRFNAVPPQCPDSSKVGTAEIETPVLPEPIEGALYIASQSDNPFHTLLSGYLVAEGQGVLLKVAGRFDTDPTTGQITATFAQNPQLPFSNLKLDFKGGNRGVVITPPSCGSYAVEAALSPWSVANPESPTAAETSFFNSPFPISAGPGGGPCPIGAFNPRLEAGTVNPTAGRYSNFVLRLSREDGTQRLSAINLTLPPGLLGKLAGIPYCPEASIASAVALTELGQGGLELASPSCPTASRLGSAVVGAGAGPEPFFVSTGNAYLAGPYKGAPLSLVVIAPAVAGPFDLGDVVVRSALNVDPETARITAVSDPLPTILHGIPLDLRDVRIILDRPEFILNPTNCEPMQIGSTVSSPSGDVAHPASRFQVGNCASLGFKPKLQLSLKGSTKHTGHPALKAVLTYPKEGAYANIARAQVNLPHSEFIDQANLNKTCTRPVLLAGNCPKTSIYGKAEAWSPLLEKPLKGPVYLVGGFGYKLPALVAELDGQIRVLLKGKVDSGPNHGIRNTFETVPDAPVSRFVLELKGGPKYSLLENSENLCQKPQRAIARFTAQNGAVEQTKPLIANQCRKKHEGKAAHSAKADHPPAGH
jgi:hypothetical protein